jgi:uncharacterized membrane protein YqjE
VSTLEALRIAPLLVRHALGYADLAGEELDGVGPRLRGRAVAAATCAFAAFLGVLLTCGLAIALAWDTAYRYWVIAGLALGFFAVAIAAGEALRRERRRGPLFGRLRDEWRQDRETLQRIMVARETPGPDKP